MPIQRAKHHLRSRPSLAQFVKYGIVGAGNTLLSVALILVGAWLGVWHIAAYALAYGAGAVNGYRMNRSWTFRAGPSHHALVVRYFVVQGAALTASTVLVYVLVDRAGVDKLLGQFVAITVAVVGGYLGNRWWTFAAVPHEPAA